MSERMFQGGGLSAGTGRNAEGMLGTPGAET